MYLVCNNERGESIMCELFGFSSSKGKHLQPYLQEFFSHSVRHPNGWGLATFENGIPKVRTEMVSAEKSKVLPAIVNSLPDSQNLLAHIRRATVGGVRQENCHPFVRSDNSGRIWTLMHNGTIFSGNELNRYKERQNGDTDSERILLYLIDLVNQQMKERGSELCVSDRIHAVEHTVRELSYRNKLNLLIYDGSRLYVHVNMRDTLFVRQQDGGTMFSTVPLGPEGWEPLPLNSLLVYDEGKLVYQGENHRNEYIDVMGRITLEYNL